MRAIKPEDIGKALLSLFSPNGPLHQYELAIKSLHFTQNTMATNLQGSQYSALLDELKNHTNSYLTDKGFPKVIKDNKNPLQDEVIPWIFLTLRFPHQVAALSESKEGSDKNWEEMKKLVDALATAAKANIGHDPANLNETINSSLSGKGSHFAQMTEALNNSAGYQSIIKDLEKLSKSIGTLSSRYASSKGFFMGADHYDIGTDTDKYQEYVNKLRTLESKLPPGFKNSNQEKVLALIQMFEGLKDKLEQTKAQMNKLVDGKLFEMDQTLAKIQKLNASLAAKPPSDQAAAIKEELSRLKGNVSRLRDFFNKLQDSKAANKVFVNTGRIKALIKLHEDMIKDQQNFRKNTLFNRKAPARTETTKSPMKKTMSGEEGEEEEQKEEVKVVPSEKLSTMELLRLALQYKRRSYLARHSNYEWRNADQIFAIYKELLGEIYKPATQDLIKGQPKLKEIFDKNFITGSNAALAECATLENMTTLNKIYRFGNEYYLINNDPDQIKLVLEEAEKGKAGYPDQETPLLDANQACIMKFLLKDSSGNTVLARNVERLRNEDKKLVFESYLPLNVTESLLKDWARSTIERFWAKAKPGTRRICFEDGYTPDQLASLISYSNFIGRGFRVSDMQKIRAFANELHTAGIIDAAQFKLFSDNQEVSLDPGTLTQCLAHLHAKYPGLDPQPPVMDAQPAWVQLTDGKSYHGLKDCGVDEWQDWSFANDHDQIPPLGQKLHGQLMAKYQAYKQDHVLAETDTVKKAPSIVQISLVKPKVEEEQKKAPKGGRLVLPPIPEGGFKLKKPEGGK